jgi:hypothetical protein
MPVMPKMPPEEEDRVGGLTFEEEQAERREYVKNIEIEYQFGCFEVDHHHQRTSRCALMSEISPLYFPGEAARFMSATR